MRPEWVERYASRLDDHRLPKGKEVRQAEAEKIRTDGHELLGEVLSEKSPVWLKQIPAVETLRKVWVQNFFYDENGNVCWRTSEEGIPRSTDYINSPIDSDCRSEASPEVHHLMGGLPDPHNRDLRRWTSQHHH